MYSGGSVINKGSTIGIDLARLSPNFHGGGVKKCGCSFQHHSTLSRTFENTARYPNDETNFLCSHDRHMSSPNVAKLGPCTPENRWAENARNAPSPKIARQKRAKSSITWPWIIRLRSNFVQSLTHDIRSAVNVQGQEVKGQCHSVT